MKIPLTLFGMLYWFMPVFAADSSDVLRFDENGDVLGVFAGHDHINDYVAEYDGIKIVNTPGVSFHAYGNEFVRGSRLITIKEDNTSEFTSEVITVNDAVYNDAELATAIDISRFTAGFWKTLENLMLGFVKFMGGIAYFIY